MLIAAGAALLVIIVLIVVVIIIINRKRKKRLLEMMIDEQKAEEEKQLEIEQYKKQLEMLARSSSMDVKDEAVLNDVRSFANENPEVTANLIRAWLKEDE